jgi:serine protease Do
MNKPLILSLSLALLALSFPNAAEDRRERVLNDRKEVESSGHWIYNDLAQGFTEAARTRKPMLVVFRCIP